MLCLPIAVYSLQPIDTDLELWALYELNNRCSLLCKSSASEMIDFQSIAPEVAPLITRSRSFCCPSSRCRSMISIELSKLEDESSCLSGEISSNEVSMSIFRSLAREYGRALLTGGALWSASEDDSIVGASLWLPAVGCLSFILEDEFEWKSRMELFVIQFPMAKAELIWEVCCVDVCSGQKRWERKGVPRKIKFLLGNSSQLRRKTSGTTSHLYSYLHKLSCR